MHLVNWIVHNVITLSVTQNLQYYHSLGNAKFTPHNSLTLFEYFALIRAPG